MGVVNILGILLEIIGVVLIARSDLLSRQIEAAYDQIPGNHLLELYQYSRDDKERIVSEEEKHHKKLDGLKDSRKDLSRFRIALILIGAGMVFQLVAASTTLFLAI